MRRFLGQGGRVDRETLRQSEAGSYVRATLLSAHPAQTLGSTHPSSPTQTLGMLSGVASCVSRAVCVPRHEAVRRRRARDTHRPRLPPPVRASAAGFAAAAAAAAVAAVPLGVLVDAAADGGARVQALTNTTAAAGTRAYVARPPSVAGAEDCTPVVVLLHQFYGLTARVRAKVRSVSAWTSSGAPRRGLSTKPHPLGW